MVLPLIKEASKEGRARWEKAAGMLKEQNVSFRILSENFIINQWDGLDILIVDPQTLSSSGIRKLQGFCAAGGMIVALSEGLDQLLNKSFDDWIDNINELLQH
jgi:hypothetical protein